MVVLKHEKIGTLKAPGKSEHGGKLCVNVIQSKAVLALQTKLILIHLIVKPYKIEPTVLDIHYNTHMFIPLFDQ